MEIASYLINSWKSKHFRREDASFVATRPGMVFIASNFAMAQRIVCENFPSFFGSREPTKNSRSANVGGQST